MNEVLREISIEAAPETVFSYFTDVQKVLQWLGIEAILEPQVGGRFQVVINSERKVMGEYLELIPYSRIVIAWGWEGREDVPPGSSRVEISFVEHAGATHLRLRHYHLPEIALPLHAKSWEHSLARLKQLWESVSQIRGANVS